MGYQADVPGLCDICGQRWRLKDLKMVYEIDSPKNILACPECWDPSHPQLDTRHVRTDDKQSVKNPRSDKAELEASRRLYAWNPVGCEATGYLELKSGRVTIRT